MKVLHLPYFESNDYQNRLLESVEKQGIPLLIGESMEYFPFVRNYRRERFDVLHLHWTHPFFVVPSYSESRLEGAVQFLRSALRAVAFLLDVLVLKLLGVGLVWTVHNKHNHERHHVRLDHAVSRVLSTLVDRITVSCPSAKETVVELFRADPETVLIIEEGNYIGSYPDEMSTAEARERLGIDPETFLFVFFGQIRPYKDVPGLLDAFDELDFSAKLLVAGRPSDDELRERLVERLATMPDAAGVLEFVPDGEIQTYVNAADVLVLPYREIMTSGSVMLGLSFGKPLVAPRLGCIPALVGEQGAFLYSPTDSDGLRDAMTAAYEAREGLDAMEEHSYERAAEFPWGPIGERTAALYRQVTLG
ncbi:glycosyltransferase family 4 protein [Halalkalicoccus subterraneus]|uniref:glycosyltransferase family 4 protein n=1 Tax=Halalkalicoccus subterraneus TaxID=2675002 RepID=UPI000EFB7837|nr:glycosyltransferase family 4 protein [Halalkalicoccus subterraneus]